MEQKKFDNMIQVLSYFADQCDMFKPMLEGVNTLKNENILLKEKVKKTNIINNRLQLNSTFSADYANFGIATVKSANEEEGNENPKISHEEDLYNLIEAVINVGKDNYVRADMEYKLDFYNMTEKLSDDQYLELCTIIKDQHKQHATLPIPVQQKDPVSKEDQKENLSINTIEKTQKEDKPSVVEDKKEQPTDIISK